MPMIDLRCAACGKRYGYAGEPADRVPCPRCGHEPDPTAAAHDQAILDEFRELLHEWRDRKTLVKPGRQRMAAGLTRGQAAKVLGVSREALADIEEGRAGLSAELAKAMAAAYGLEG